VNFEFLDQFSFFIFWNSWI